MASEARVVVASADGESRVVFRPVPGHRHDEQWQERDVRTLPELPAGSRLAYYNSSKTISNSNVLQVILRDHGFERVEAADESSASGSTPMIDL